uniref:Clusterin-associated protein 1 n=1 Tax=Acrobeloides nanus TaxID=290746 RepID=A0A914CCT9_9BILA
MSYRELRDATEILRSLDYPRLVSIENFRTPNFELIAEILEWIVRRFDPNVRVPKLLDTESDRVIFIKTCVLSLIQKARVKLNPKKLYQADGHAIRELMPLFKMLYQTTKASKDPNDESAAQISLLRSRISSMKQEIRMCVQLASEIPHSGVTLYDLLAKEIFAKESRMRAMSQSLNISDIEKIIRGMIEKSARETAEIEEKLNNISSDEASLDAKIDRRRREYDQLQKRLAKLQSFRPQYMDEYERYEEQLKGLYTEYVVKFRNLSYLQQQLWEVERAEKERSMDAERSMRLAVEKMRVDSQTVPPIEGLNVEDESQTKKVVKVYGNMTGAGLSDDEDEEDDGLGPDEEPELEDEHSELSEFSPEAMEPKVQQQIDENEDKENHSEDDF